MSFGTSIRRALNESLPVGARYMALLTAIERSHLSYGETWANLTALFGVQIGDRLTHEQFVQIATYLSTERAKWRARCEEERRVSRQRKYAGGIITKRFGQFGSTER